MRRTPRVVEGFYMWPVEYNVLDLLTHEFGIEAKVEGFDDIGFVGVQNIVHSPGGPDKEDTAWLATYSHTPQKQAFTIPAQPVKMTDKGEVEAVLCDGRKVVLRFTKRVPISVADIKDKTQPYGQGKISPVSLQRYPGHVPDIR